MLRSETQIATQTDQLTEKFVSKVYAMAAKRQRGVSYEDNFNVNYILLKSLKQNAIFGTLSTEQENSIIDTLI